MNWILSADLAIKQMKFKNWIKEREGMLEIDYESIHDFELNELLKKIESRPLKSDFSGIKTGEINHVFESWWLTFPRNERLTIISIFTMIILTIIGWIISILLKG